MGRYLNPTTHRWEGENAEFTPESDNIPWSFVPEHKITVEDVKYLLSSYYQGTAYNPFSKTSTEGGKYRPIGISRTGVMAILQLRGYLPEEISALEWICFGANPFNAALPVYANVDKMPAYLDKVTMQVSTDTFYWANRLIGAMADAHYGSCIQLIERYQAAIANGGTALVHENDRRMVASSDFTGIEKVNQSLADMAKKEATDALGKVLHQASLAMHCGYQRADN